MVIFFAVFFQVFANKFNEEIDVWFNHLSPRWNPLKFTKSQRLFDCSVKFKDEFYTNSFAEDLEDLTFIDSGMEVNFKQPVRNKLFCGVNLDETKIDWLFHALQAESILEVRVQGLVNWVPIGDLSKDNKTAKIFTHYKIELFYNEQVIVHMKLTPMLPLLLEKLENIDFSYEVNWKSSNVSLENQVTSYNIMQKQMGKIYYYSVVWNLCLVLLVALMVCVGIWYKVINDIKSEKKSGWLQIKDGIYKPPEYLTFFSSFVATGWQFGAVLCSVVFINYFFEIYLVSGGNSALFLYTYIGFATLSGFAYGLELYKYRGKSNSLFLALNSSLVNVMLFCLFILKSIVNDYLMDFRSFFIVLSIFCLVYTPLYILGYYSGKTFSKRNVIRYSETIENEELLGLKNEKPWVFIICAWIWMVLQMIPVLDSIMNTVTKFVHYSNYGFLIGSVVSQFIAVGLNCAFTTFIALENENRDWHWISFLTGAGVGIGSFGYGVYVYFIKLDINGVFENLYFFYYIGTCSFILSLVFGAVGYYSAGIMVKKIYSLAKKD